MGVTTARKQTGQGFMCNRTIKGPHGSSDGNTSIFRGLSHVPAFFRDLERYLTLEVRSQGISVLFVKGSGTCMWVNEYVSGAGVRERCTAGENRRKIWKERRNVLSTGAQAATGGTSI